MKNQSQQYCKGILRKNKSNEVSFSFFKKEKNKYLGEKLLPTGNTHQSSFLILFFFFLLEDEALLTKNEETPNIKNTNIAKRTDTMQERITLAENEHEVRRQTVTPRKTIRTKNVHLKLKKKNKRTE